MTIYEVGTLGANGAPYIAMELLRGHDLGWHLRQRGSLPVDEVVSLAEQVGLGLEAARAAGIVHRDLKPQNVFLAQQHAAAPAWKILDFGVSRLAGTTGTLTMDQIVGTPGYMSPEQAGGREATHRSDIFSFGAVVYRALTGQPAFSGPDTPQVLYQVVYRNPPRPSLLMPGLPTDLDIVLAIAMAKDLCRPLRLGARDGRGHQGRREGRARRDPPRARPDAPRGAPLGDLVARRERHRPGRGPQHGLTARQSAHRKPRLASRAVGGRQLRRRGLRVGPPRATSSSLPQKKQ